MRSAVGFNICGGTQRVREQNERLNLIQPQWRSWPILQGHLELNSPLSVDPCKARPLSPSINHSLTWTDPGKGAWPWTRQLQPWAIPGEGVSWEQLAANIPSSCWEWGLPSGKWGWEWGVRVSQIWAGWWHPLHHSGHAAYSTLRPTELSPLYRGQQKLASGLGAVLHRLYP